MENNDYVNHYIDIMSATLTDAVLRNISLQANAKVTEKVLENQARVIEELQQDTKVADLEKTIEELQGELAKVNNLRGEYENVKHQAQHVDTFRNELVKERESNQKTRDDYEKQIASLNEKIEYLQLTPAKRKKVDEAKAVALSGSTVDVTTLVDATIKDGGSF
jgi:chromosome segregation ATPase